MRDDDPFAGTSYRAVRGIGQGGMGEVFEVEHRGLGLRLVAKVLHEHLADHAQIADRLRLEAQALARLAPHPNLVLVHDLGVTPTGRAFFVMEKLVGRTLHQELAEHGVLGLTDAIDLARQALAALSVAHAAGVVHRDLKLQNLFLCDAAPGERRALKVLDFGIAKVVADAGETAPRPLAIPTDDGCAVGTPRFFSPEQARGRAVDARSDVYALGIVLYTLVAGRGPFDHVACPAGLARAHVLERPERPSTLAPQPVPAALDRAILRAIAKKPEQRFQTADAFEAELARIAAEMPELWLSLGASVSRSYDDAPTEPFVRVASKRELPPRVPAATERPSQLDETRIARLLPVATKTAAARPPWIMICALVVALTAAIFLVAR